MGFVGVTIQNELDEVGSKPTADDQANRAKRQRIIERYLGVEEPAATQFADPALFFS